MEKIYTQEDMDNITSKVKESQRAKYEKTHIAIEAFQELENKYNSLVMENKRNQAKDIFKANNGKLEAWEDFIASNEKVLNFENNETLDNSIKSLVESKSFYFNTQQPNINNSQNTNDNDVLTDLLQTGNEDLIDGTIYKK